MALPQGHASSRHHAPRHIRPLPPAVALPRLPLLRTKLIHILEEFYLPVVCLTSSTDQIHAVTLTIVLRYQNRKAPGRARPGGQLLPLPCCGLTSQFQRPKTGPCLCERCRARPRGDIHRVANRRAAAIRRRLRKRRQRCPRNLLANAVPSQKKGIVKGARGVVSSRTHHALGGRHRDAVAEWPRQPPTRHPPPRLPRLAGRQQDPDRVVPGLLRLPDGRGKVGTTGHDHGAVSNPHKGPSHAQWIREIGEGLAAQLDGDSLRTSCAQEPHAQQHAYLRGPPHHQFSLPCRSRAVPQPSGQHATVRSLPPASAAGADASAPRPVLPVPSSL